MTTTTDTPAVNGTAAPQAHPEIPGGTPRLNAALAAVQSEYPRVLADQKATIPPKDGKSGYSYNYSDLGGFSTVVCPLLGKHGLAFTSRPTILDGRFVLIYELVHASGEQKDGVWPLPASFKPQELGGLLTYYKRYALSAVTGISPVGVDDDANSANHEQRFDGGYGSAGEAFASAAPAPRNGQQRRPERPAARPVEPLAADDPWKPKIEDLATDDEANRAWLEVVELREAGTIDEARSIRLKAAIKAHMAKVAPAGAGAAGASDPEPAGTHAPSAQDAADDAAAESFYEPAPAPAEPAPAAEAAAEPAGDGGPDTRELDFVAQFNTDLAEAGDARAILAMQRRLGDAIRNKVITTDTLRELQEQVAAKVKANASKDAA